MELQILDIIGISFVVLSFGFIIANLISNRKLSVISVFLFLITGGSLALRLFKNELFIKYIKFIPQPEKSLPIAAGAVFLLTFFEFMIFSSNASSKQRILKQGVFYDESRILAYVTKGNRMFQHSKKIEEIIRGLKQADNQFKIQKVVFDNNEIPLKQVIKSIARCNGITNETVKFKIRYNNGFENDLEVIKKPVTKNVNSNRVIGYALIDSAITNSERIELDKNHKRNLFIYLDLLNQPIAYLDKNQNGYVLTNSLSRLLSYDERIISIDNFKKLIHPEDITEFENNRNPDTNIDQRFFRLKSGNSYFWFEEKVVRYFENDYIILKKTDSSYSIDFNMGTYKSMVKKIEYNYENNLDFALVILNMSNLPDITSSMGADYSDIIVNKFYTAVLNSNLKDQVQVFKIGSVEYALIIDGQEYVDLTIRSLANNQSILLNQDVYVSRKRNHIQCQLGLVLSLDINSKDPRVIIKAAFDTIKEAIDINFANNYSIYQPVEIVEKEYNLKELGIDLNEDLDDFIDVLED